MVIIELIFLIIYVCFVVVNEPINYNIVDTKLRFSTCCSSPPGFKSWIGNGTVGLTVSFGEGELAIGVDIEVTIG